MYFFFNQLIVAALILTMTLIQKDPKGMKSSPSKTHCTLSIVRKLDTISLPENVPNISVSCLLLSFPPCTSSRLSSSHWVSSCLTPFQHTLLYRTLVRTTQLKRLASAPLRALQTTCWQQTERPPSSHCDWNWLKRELLCCQRFCCCTSTHFLVLKKFLLIKYLEMHLYDLPWRLTVW